METLWWVGLTLIGIPPKVEPVTPRKAIAGSTTFFILKTLTMETFENILIRVLMVSVDKHGSEKPVTLEHLLNIVRLAQSIAEGLHSSSDEAIHDALMQNVDPHDDKG